MTNKKFKFKRPEGLLANSVSKANSLLPLRFIAITASLFILSASAFTATAETPPSLVGKDVVPSLTGTDTVPSLTGTDTVPSLTGTSGSGSGSSSGGSSGGGSSGGGSSSGGSGGSSGGSSSGGSGSSGTSKDKTAPTKKIPTKNGVAPKDQLSKTGPEIAFLLPSSLILGWLYRRRK